MTGADGTVRSVATRLRVRSADGTTIAVTVTGVGRPLVVVPGTTSDHSSWDAVAPLLAPTCHVFAVDRRGRGASGDGSAYSLEAELADVAAVVDAAAAAYGDPVDLLGHSFGGFVAYGAAALTPNVRRLVLYEGWPAPNIADRVTPPKVLARLDDLLAAGALEATLEAFLRDVARASDAEIAGARAAPSWPARVAAAATIPRELRAFAERSLDAASAQALAMPVLLITGATSPPAIRADPDAVAAALPDARIVELAGHGHLAHVTAPHELAAVVLAFLAAG